MVRLQDLRKTYDTVTAVQDLSLDVAAGTTMGLIGPNGSGKTTLLRLIATLAKPDRGSIDINGYSALGDVRRVRRLIGFMPAEYGFPPQMTIREYMEYFACLTGVAPTQRPSTIDQVLELTDLKEREEIGVRGLSTGNRQRLLLAKTLVNDPALLLLDEPASGLDPRARAEVRAILRELSHMGKTIIISSHILADLEDICDEVCILEEGRRVLAGSIDDLRHADMAAAAGRAVRIRVAAADLERAAAVLQTLETTTACELLESQLRLITTDPTSKDILQRLLDAEIEIIEFSVAQPGLEDIFIRSTKGKVT